MTASDHQRFLAGDVTATEAVVRQAGRITMPLAIAVLGDRDAAADVAQDVALDVLRGLHRLSDPGRFDAWVRRIAVRHSIRAARRRRLLRGIEFPLEADVTDPETPATETVLLRAALRAALADLSVRQRAAVASAYIHGLSERPDRGSPRLPRWDGEFLAHAGPRPPPQAGTDSWQSKEALHEHSECICRPP